MRVFVRDLNTLLIRLLKSKVGFFLSSKSSTLVFLTLALVSISWSQEKNITAQHKDPLDYEEIPVTVFIEQVGQFDMNVLYASNEKVYIPILDLFYAVKIACKVEDTNLSLEGFINSEANTYKVNYHTKQLLIGTKIINVEKELLEESGYLYLESSVFQEAFGISLTFDFRSLSIKFKANFELPIVKQARIAKMQQNVAKVKGEEKVDTIIKRDYHLFKPGTLDWNVASYQNWKGETANTVGLGLGSELLFGEANISLNYNDQYGFNNRQLNYHWRWIDNDKTLIRQAQVGKVFTQSIASLNAPLIGATIRNSPTTLRKATGNYTITDTTEPNWTIELYINSVLVDFTKADAAGNFRFTVPIVYGFTTITLKYYGPTGEERTEERIMNVPYTVMSPKEFEYGITTGFLQDSTHSAYSKGEFYYGLNRKLTIGGGVEYLSRLENGAVMPFAKATFQPFNKLILNAEYVHNVRSRGLLNYYITRDILLELDYANYVEGQKATLFNASEELKVKLAAPFRYQKLNGYFKLDYTQLKYASFDFNYANVLLSANYKQMNINTSSQLNWIDSKSPYITNDLALSYRFKNNIIVRPSLKFNTTEGSLVSYKTEIEKNTYLGYFSISYEKNNLAKDHYLNISFKYDLNFARVNTVASIRKGSFTTSESAQGSIAFGGANQYVHYSNNSSTGKGGLVIYPFLDINNNGKFDKDEKIVLLRNVKIAGGKTTISEKDSLIRIPDLNAFTNYTLTFSDADLDNIAWRFKHHSYQVLIDPNQFKRIDIPINVVGEMSGMVSRAYKNTVKGIARILVKIYQANSDQLVAETLSESDGYIYYLGLKPGDYKACIDSDQLNNLNLEATPNCQFFTIKTLQEGDIVDGLDFVLSDQKQELPKDLENKAINNNLESELQTEKGVDSTKQLLPENIAISDTKADKNELYDHSFSNNFKPWYAHNINKTDTGAIVYVVQLMASKSAVNIHKYFSKIHTKIPSIQIFETYHKDGWYRYQTGVYNTQSEALSMVQKIKATGWKDFFIAPYISIK